MRHFGFLVPATLLVNGEAGFPNGNAPSVLVGLSTTYQHQERLLQVILDALGELEVRGIASSAGQVDLETLRCPPNVVVREFVEHATVLPDCDVMVTHAGLGSVAAALSRGVPLVCTPIGRDQHLNAQRVVSVGAGRNVGADAQVADVAEAVQAVLADHSYQHSARSLAEESRQAGGSTTAIEDLERLMSS
jgi:MGT family glycosyltransferase